MNTDLEKKEANDRKWSRRAVTFDDRRYDFFRFMQKELISLVKIHPSINFLDLGCGTGRAVVYVAETAAGKGNFVGVDIAKGMIEKARSNAQGLANVRFYQTSADNLPLENDFFDTVICTNSFHHYPEPVTALSEVRRILKPGGKIYILDVTADDGFIRWIDRRTRANENGHVKFYSTKEYGDMFNSACLIHEASRMLKIFYPLKVHIGMKPR